MAPTGWPGPWRSWPSPRPCRRCWRRGSIGSPNGRSTRCKRPRSSASASGRRFSGAWPTSRSRISPTALRVLTDAEFVYEEVLYPEAEYAFAHPLTQEVAYGSQLGERRRHVHEAAARALEELEANRLDERAGLLAHHWEMAGEPLPAARWHRRAAVWAGAAHSQEALRHWRRVRALLRDVAESSETLALGVEAAGQVLLVGARTGRLDEDADALRAEAEELAERSRNPRARILFRFAYAMYRLYSGSTAAAVEALRETVELADELRDASLGVAARFYLAIALGSAGPLGESVAKREAGAYRRAHGLLTDAYEEFRETDQERLLRHIDGHLSVLGDRKMGPVVAPDDLDSALLMYGGRSLALASPPLSYGELHVALFAVRMGAADFLAGMAVRLPLLVDDPFVHLDAGRAAEIWDVLCTIARERQVILTTQDRLVLEHLGVRPDLDLDGPGRAASAQMELPVGGLGLG